MVKFPKIASLAEIGLTLYTSLHSSVTTLYGNMQRLELHQSSYNGNALATAKMDTRFFFRATDHFGGEVA